MPQTAKGNIANGTAIAQNVNFFTNNLTPDNTSPGVVKFRISISVSTTGCILNVTHDGTHFAQLNAGIALNQNSEYAFDIQLRTGDLFNVQASNASGCTIVKFRVDEIVDED